MITRWKIIRSAIFAFLTVIGVIVGAYLAPPWLFVLVFLSLLVFLLVYTLRIEGARKAWAEFFKRLFFGW